jgi:competence protein ComEA
VVLVLGWRALGKDSASSQPQAVKVPSTVRSSAPASGGLRVYVVGQVKAPGVYRLPATARVEDAVSSAGGATAKADLAAINLASKVTDGQQIIVPKHGQQSAVVGGGPVVGSAAASAPDAQIDLNNATTEQLDTLDGVGPATAKKILAYRAQHGPFKSVSELAQIPGIGPKKLAAMKPRLRV